MYPYKKFRSPGYKSVRQFSMEFSNTKAEKQLWLAEAADDDLNGFIANASDAEFTRRFPAWFEAREKFSYDIYKNGIYEHRFQAQRQGLQPMLSVRDCRRAYKVGMAKVMARLECEHKKRCVQMQVAEVQSHNCMQDCLRCILIERGDEYIKNHTIFSCAISAPAGVEITEDRLLKDKTDFLEAGNEEIYPEVLAISTSIGNIECTPAICTNVPPPFLIQNRKIEDQSCFQYVNEEHKCKASSVQLNQTATIKLSVGQYETTPENMLLYAPSGFGKTTLQTVLAERGIAIADTDDMPGADIERLKQVLRKTSVLTNRLDLIREPSIRGIMFIPDSVDTLKHCMSHFGLHDEDLQYFCDVHERVVLRENLTKCRVKNMHLLYWLKCAKGKTVIARDLAFEESFIMKASYQASSN